MTMNPPGFAKGLFKYALKTVASFLIISALFLAFSNMEALKEDPTGTAKGIFETQKDLILHPSDVLNMITGSGMPALKDLSKIADVDAQPTEFEQLILVYTNKERIEAGLGQVEWSGGLALVARDHSLDMIDRDFFEHVNPDGQDPTDRFVEMYGYAPEKALGPAEYIVGVGENLGQITFQSDVEGCGEIGGPDSAAACQVNSWMDSPAHRANILDAKYTHLGVGAAVTGETHYITQVFW